MLLGVVRVSGGSLELQQPSHSPIYLEAGYDRFAGENLPRGLTWSFED